MQPKIRPELNPRADRVRQQIGHIREQLIDVDRLQIEPLGSRKSQQLPGQAACTSGRVQNVSGQSLVAGVVPPPLNEIRVADDGRQ